MNAAESEREQIGFKRPSFINVVPTAEVFRGVQLTSIDRAAAGGWKLLSEQTVTGFSHPSSVACDHWNNMIYVTDYGPELEPTAANDKGVIIKMTDKGKILDRDFLKPAGEVFHRPKGLFIYGPKLWMADLNSVWLFDFKSNGSKKLELPGIAFADHVTLDYTSKLYVSDSRSDRVVRWEPSDFLNVLRTQPVGPLRTVYSGGGIFPTGIYPGRRGGLYMVGSKSKDDPSGIYFMRYSLDEQYEPTNLKPAEPYSEKIGQLDGIKWLNDNEFLLTDWTTGSLLLWTKDKGVEKLATGFKGPADVCTALRPMNKREMLVAVPDIIKGEVRLMWFSLGDTVLGL